jgi:predicted nucleic acid-binding protein
MILFCDTSALFKLYISEPDSDLVRVQRAHADAVVVCRITWAEAHAAFARRLREIPENEQSIGIAKVAMARDWPHFGVFEVTQDVVERAGEYADVFALRGYDSVQLATAYEVANISQTEIVFACFDTRLNKAAKTLGMRCL